MGCVNTVHRYIVRMRAEKGDFGKAQGWLNGMLPIPHVVAVSGLQTGTSNQVQVHEQRGSVSIPTGRITGLQPLKLTIRSAIDVPGLLVRDLLFKWAKNRETNVATVWVDVTTQGFCPLFTYTFRGCTYIGAPFDELSMASPKVPNFELLLAPYNVILDHPSLDH